MFDTYTEIFEERGRAYHQAMVEQPRARDQEFQHIVDCADLASGQRVCDAPSGGGYLGRHTPDGVALFSLETAAAFARLAYTTSAPAVHVSMLERLPYAAGAFDRIISAAALHHVEDKAAFHREAYRCLAPGGALCVADVPKVSAVAEFLDGFVGGHSTMGHNGLYVDDGYPAHLEEAGFTVDQSTRTRFDWSFETVEGMVRFARLLFGIDRATDDEVRAAIEGHTGWRATAGGVVMGWELAFFRAVKPPSA